MHEADDTTKTETSQETYNLLQAILNGTSDGIYAKDLQGRYVMVNAAGAAFVGSTVEQMRGEHYSAILSAAETAEITEEDNAVVGTGQSQSIDTQGNLQGKTHFFQTIKTPYRSAEGNVLGVVSISRDVTEQKRAEVALGQSEEEYRAMFELAGVGNTQVDFWSGRILRANRKLCDMLGYSVAELLNKTFLDVTHPDDRSTNLDYFERRQQGELDGYSLEKRYLRKDGTVVWGEMHTTLIRDPGGEPLYVIATVQDITARKEAEAEQARLFAAEQEARAAAERGRQRASFVAAVSTALASSLDYSSTLLRVARLSVNSFATWCIIDLLTDGQIRRTAFAAHGSELEPLLHELCERYPIDPTGSHPIALAIRNEKAVFVPVMPLDYAERIGSDARHSELLRQLPCGSCIVVPLTARGQRLGAISFVSGQPGRYSATDLALAEQIAYRASLAIDNAQLYQQSENSVRLRDQFLTIASHELKSPLTSLVGYAELLERRVAEPNNFDERDRRAIRIMAQQTARLEKMIETMFDVSRIEHGRISITREPLDLNLLTTQVTGQMRLLLRRHVLDLRLADAPVVIEGDELRLEQVVQNLIQNAIKYSPLGGTISVEVRGTSDMAMLSVSDQGIGIPEAALPHLFSRFYRAPNADAWHFSGMGIGLYIAQEIIRLHEGEIQVSSEEGKGSTFTVCLPPVRMPLDTSGFAYSSSPV